MPQARRTIAVAFAALAFSAAVDASAAHGHRRHGRSTAARGAVVAAAPAAPVKAAAPSGRHVVVFVTDKRAYLDSGALDGLRARQSLQIVRAGRPVGACTIETLAEHQATCVGARLRVGDGFRVAARAAARTSAAVPELPAIVDEDTLRGRAQAVADEPFEKVDFKGTPGFRSHARATVSPSFTIWRTQPDAGGNTEQVRLDGALQAVELGSTGMRLDAAFSAVRWQQPVTERFRPGQPTQFYLWEAEVSRRQLDARTVFAVGRIWPWHAPGLTTLDGLQIGRENEARTIEGGAYAGFIPTPTSLAPVTDAWTTGLYGALVQTGGKKSTFRLAREETRVSVWRTPTTGLVTEGEGLAQAWLGPFNLGGGARGQLGQATDNRPVLERAYFDLGARPSLTFGAGLHARYFGTTLPDEALLRAETPAPLGGAHGLADVRWDPAPSVGLAAFAGAHRDTNTGRYQLQLTGELRLARLLGDFGGLWLGAGADEGWMRGRIAYGQLVGHVRDRVRLLARASVSTTEFETPTSLWNVDEVGGYVHAEGVFTSSFRLRVWSLVRVPFLVLGAAPNEALSGLTAGGALTGTF